MLNAECWWTISETLHLFLHRHGTFHFSSQVTPHYSLPIRFLLSVPALYVLTYITLHINVYVSSALFFVFLLWGSPSRVLSRSLFNYPRLFHSLPPTPSIVILSSLYNNSCANYQNWFTFLLSNQLKEIWALFSATPWSYFVSVFVLVPGTLGLLFFHYEGEGRFIFSHWNSWRLL